MTTDELKYAELVCGSVYAESTIASVTHIIQYYAIVDRKGIQLENIWHRQGNPKCSSLGDLWGLSPTWSHSW